MKPKVCRIQRISFPSLLRVLCISGHGDGLVPASHYRSIKQRKCCLSSKKDIAHWLFLVVPFENNLFPSTDQMSNQISNGSRRGTALSSVDFYRRVPKDLTEVSSVVNKAEPSGTFRILRRILREGYQREVAQYRLFLKSEPF